VAGDAGDLVVDAWAQLPNERFLAEPWNATLLRWTNQPAIAPPSVSDTLAAYDAAGVDRALICAWSGPQGMLISNDEVARTVAQAPDRFHGVAAVDLRYPVRAVRELQRYYPLYAACVELGVPFCTQIGHTGPLCPSEPGRPIPYLDNVLLEFPELVVVGGHVGYPWIDEVLSLATKYPNFYVDTSAYAVHRLPAALVDYMRGRGRSRVLFGTNWPMLSPQRSLAQLAGLGLDEEAARLYLGGNAVRVFDLVKPPAGG
jgi:uncharacterized protein